MSCKCCEPCKHEYRKPHSPNLYCSAMKCKSECVCCQKHLTEKPNLFPEPKPAEPRFVPPTISHNEIDPEWGRHENTGVDKKGLGRAVKGSIVTSGGSRRNIAGFDQATPAEQRLLIHAKDLYDAATEVCGYVENRVHSVKPIKKLFQALDKIDGKTHGIKMFDYIK